MFYSKLTGGFYSPEIHATMPSDVVEITVEQHQALIDGQSQGKVITSDKDGYPVLTDYVVTPEQLAEQVKAEAQAYLASTDWYVTRFTETGTPIPEDVLSKRAEARLKI